MVDVFLSQESFMTSGACLVVAVQRDNAVLAFEALLGRCVFVDVKLATSI